ncbi:MAG: hypothetical protein RLZZ200_1057 [Pseudomonadota bacterium]|jgi:hypothetical protein
MPRSVQLFLVLLASRGMAAGYGEDVRLEASAVTPVNVSVVDARIGGRHAVKVIKDDAVKAFDEPTFARVGGKPFRDGTIQVRVYSRLLKDAPELARGFLGIVFRVNADASRFEGIYVRPLNARVEDQVRRNHSIQYFSYPDYKFDRLRVESAGKYEAYADMDMEEWIDLRIEVRGERARLFINGAKQPSLVVTDLKQGVGEAGAVGLWTEVGTEAYFSDLRISSE